MAEEREGVEPGPRADEGMAQGVGVRDDSSLPSPDAESGDGAGVQGLARGVLEVGGRVEPGRGPVEVGPFRAALDRYAGGDTGDLAGPAKALWHLERYLKAMHKGLKLPKGEHYLFSIEFRMEGDDILTEKGKVGKAAQVELVKQ